jgi:hypothetical protein
MIGESPGRKEDLPLLTGRARFVDDISRPGMLHLGADFGITIHELPVTPARLFTWLRAAGSARCA